MSHSDPVADVLLVHAGFVQRLAGSLVGRDLGEDLAQDAWLHALRQEPRDRSNLRGWLSRIVSNLASNFRRETRRRTQRETAVAATADEPSVASIVEREDVRQKVVAAVLQLPAPLRQVVLLRFYEDLDSRVIGERLGRPASTVRAQLRQALLQLRSQLDGDHGTGRAAWSLPLARWLHAASSPLPALLRVSWPLRSALGVLAAGLLAWLSAPLWLGPPPLPQARPDATPMASRSDASADPEPTAAAERQQLASAVASTEAKGPEDLWGRIVGAADAPVPGAEVELQYREADEFKNLDLAFGDETRTVGRTQTDAEGRFQFRVGRALQHRLLVRATGFAPRTVPYCTGGSEFVVRLERGAFVAGKVLAKENGEPLADVRVEAVVRGSVHGAQTQTLADGTFLLADLPPEPSYVRVQPEGREEPEWQLVELQPGQTAQVTLTVALGRTVKGVITDAATGQPVAGAEVGSDWTFGDAQRSGHDGSYVLRGLGDRAQLHVRAGGHALAVRPVPSEPEPRLDVALARGGSLAGRFVDDHGQAVAAVYAAAGLNLDELNGRSVDWRRARVGADGRFRVDDLVADRCYQLFVRGAGVGTRVYALPPNAADRTLDLGDVVLLPPASLEGRVVDDAGQPLGVATVILTGTNRDYAQRWTAGTPQQPLYHFQNRETRTSADGAFRIGGIASGAYQLHVQPAGKRWQVDSGPHELADGEVKTGVTVEVAMGLSIRGFVRGLRALPPAPQFVISAQAGDRTSTTARVDADGAFALERLEPGSYLLEAFDPPAGHALVPVSVTAGNTEVELVLLPAQTIEGRVVDKHDRPVRGASACFFRTGARGAKLARTDAQGRFRLEVPPGLVGRVVAMHPDGFPQVSLDDIASGARDLVLHLP